MAGMADRLELELTNDLSELGRLAEAVDEFCERNGFPMGLAFKLNLCFDELITNTVSYGYRDAGPHTIRVRLEADDAEVRAEVEDDAAPFDPFNEAPEPDLDASVEDRRVGGLGVFLVKQSMDRATYRRQDGRNLVNLAKAVGP